MRPSLVASPLCTLACLTTLSILTASYLVVRNQSRRDQQQVHKYTYVGDDHPEHLPLLPVDPVALVVEDPSHYPILGVDAREEWASSTPKGFGYLRLGPEHRPFAPAMFHEYHCLRVMRGGLSGSYIPQIVTHMGHCLVYLRQMILCSPDLTLEPYNALDRDFTIERAGAIHVCQDWRQLYDEMARNWEEWVDTRSRLFPTNHTTADGSNAAE